MTNVQLLLRHACEPTRSAQRVLHPHHGVGMHSGAVHRVVCVAVVRGTGVRSVHVYADLWVGRGEVLGDPGVAMLSVASTAAPRGSSAVTRGSGSSCRLVLCLRGERGRGREREREREREKREREGEEEREREEERKGRDRNE